MLASIVLRRRPVVASSIVSQQIRIGATRFFHIENANGKRRINKDFSLMKRWGVMGIEAVKRLHEPMFMLLRPTTTAIWTRLSSTLDRIADELFPYHPPTTTELALDGWGLRAAMDDDDDSEQEEYTVHGRVYKTGPKTRVTPKHRTTIVRKHERQFPHRLKPKQANYFKECDKCGLIKLSHRYYQHCLGRCCGLKDEKYKNAPPVPTLSSVAEELGLKLPPTVREKRDAAWEEFQAQRQQFSDDLLEKLNVNKRFKDYDDRETMDRRVKEIIFSNSTSIEDSNIGGNAGDPDQKAR